MPELLIKRFLCYCVLSLDLCVINILRVPTSLLTSCLSSLNCSPLFFIVMHKSIQAYFLIDLKEAIMLLLLVNGMHKELCLADKLPYLCTTLWYCWIFCYSATVPRAFHGKVCGRLCKYKVWVTAFVSSPLLSS